MMSPIDAATWSGVGVAATLVCGYIAHKMGRLQFGVMEKSYGLAALLAEARVGCDVRVEERNTLGAIYPSHLFVTVDLYNEGQLPASALKGDWKLLPHHLFKNSVFPLQREFLGNCEHYTKTEFLNESAGVGWKDIAFDIRVDFYYSVPGVPNEQRYHQNYRYDRSSGQTIKVQESDK